MVTQSLTSFATKTSLESTSYSIVHCTKGRIRLRIPRLGKDPAYAVRLQRSLNTYSAITEVHVNVVACSITVCYSPQELSTNQFCKYLAIALQQATAPIPTPCTTKVLAKRLGVSLPALNWRRSQVDFAAWSRAKDPQGIAWSYDATTKCFSAYQIATPAANPASAKAERIFQALNETASSHLGGMVGRVAGEMLGLALLGAAGAVVGAEIGTLVGEIVGGELGSA